VLRNAAVPLIVDSPQERLGQDDLPPQLGDADVVQGQAASEWVAEPIAKDG